MANQLYNILTFTNIGAGLGSTQSHLLNTNSVNQIPDFIWVNNEQFSVSATSTQVTVTNNGGTAASCNVWCAYLHTILREFGPASVLALTPDPYILIGGGFGGSPSGIEQRFLYTATGAEGSDFMVTLPLVRANDTYFVFTALDGVTNIVGIDTPNILAGDRTTTQFRVITTANVTAGDRFAFQVVNPT